jgi:hypothetical protein
VSQGIALSGFGGFLNKEAGNATALAGTYFG